MKHVWVGVACLTLVVGCAAFQQAKVDYEVGATAPLEAEETVPREAAEELLRKFQDVPYVGPFIPYAILGLTGFLTYQRGRRIRKQLPVKKASVTGSIGKKIGLDWLLQHLATLVQGAVEVGPNESGLKRVWKVSVAALAALLVTNSPELAVALTALLSGIEKELANVLPTERMP